MDDISATLISIDDRLRRIEMRQERQGTAVNVLSAGQMATALAVSLRAVQRLHASKVFTDARPPEERGARHRLRFYADEVPVYLAEGRAGLKRYRRELGRA